MNILFDIGHPAHVHLFKNFIFFLQRNNYKVTTVSRDKDVTINLLDHYGILHKVLSTSGVGFLSQLNELIIRDKKLIKLHKEKKFSMAFGTSISIAHLTVLTGLRSYNFHEDDDSVVPLQSLLIYPFTSAIINPDCVKIRGWRKKRVFYQSYHELAYLHPDNFSPDPSVPAMYGLEVGNYVIVRLSGLRAHHDRAKKGISKSLLHEIKNTLSGHVFIESVESNSYYSFKPWHMHDLIAYAKMVISDSQTTTAEAAVLGVPSIRYNSFVGSINYLEELEHKYNLANGFLPGQEKQMLEQISYILNKNNISKEFKENRNKMLQDKIDLSLWMKNYFLNYIIN